MTSNMYELRCWRKTVDCPALWANQLIDTPSDQWPPPAHIPLPMLSDFTHWGQVQPPALVWPRVCEALALVRDSPRLASLLLHRTLACSCAGSFLCG